LKPGVELHAYLLGVHKLPSDAAIFVICFLDLGFILSFASRNDATIDMGCA